MWLAILIGFLFAFYVGASIVRSVRGYEAPPDPKSKKLDTIKERIQ